MATLNANVECDLETGFHVAWWRECRVPVVRLLLDEDASLRERPPRFVSLRQIEVA